MSMNCGMGELQPAAGLLCVVVHCDGPTPASWLLAEMENVWQALEASGLVFTGCLVSHRGMAACC